MNYRVEIVIEAASLQDARDKLLEIADAVEADKFCATSSVDDRARYGGSVFVTQED